MGRPSIAGIYNKAMYDISRLDLYIQKSKHLQPDIRGYVVEILMLRLFSVLESSVREIAFRVACGAPYRNGSSSSPIVVCATLNDAFNNFKTYNRRKSLSHLKFTNVSSTNDTIKHIIDTSEPFRVKLSAYGVRFEEMRKVRNHIAHHYKNTYTEYRSVICARFGAFKKIRPAVFLNSQISSTNRMTFIEEYLKITKALINDITAGR